MPSPTTSPRSDLETTPHFPSLVRPALIAGLEREVLIPVVGLVLMLAFGFRPNWVTPALGAGLVLLVLPVLRRATRRDFQVFEVLRDHVRVAGYYPAAGSHDAPRRSAPTFKGNR